MQMRSLSAVSKRYLKGSKKLQDDLSLTAFEQQLCDGDLAYHIYFWVFKLFSTPTHESYHQC